MLMKTLIVAGALILAAAGGTAYAADEVPTTPNTFSALGGVEAEAMSSAEMASTVGAFLRIKSPSAGVTMRGTYDHSGFYHVGNIIL